jgi:DNA-directed RNA polymerase subunit K/omega
MIRPPEQMGKFEFVAVAALRAAQLTRGCRPRVDGDHTTAVFAQREVAEGKVTRSADGAVETPADEPAETPAEAPALVGR